MGLINHESVGARGTSAKVWAKEPAARRWRGPWRWRDRPFSSLSIGQGMGSRRAVVLAWALCLSPSVLVAPNHQQVTAALKDDHTVRTKKRIDWYTERCGNAGGSDTPAACAAAVEFATVSHPWAVDGIMPCCNMLHRLELTAAPACCSSTPVINDTISAASRRLSLRGKRCPSRWRGRVPWLRAVQA